MPLENKYLEMIRMMLDLSRDYLSPGHSTLDHKPNAAERKLFTLVFEGYTEIIEAVDMLELTETLLSTAPPRSKKIDPARYLHFLVGSYFGELYILEQRMKSYASQISRAYGSQITAQARKIVYVPLEDLIKLRGAHVHVARFTDESIRAVSMMSLFKRTGHHLGEDLEIEYKMAQKKWVKAVRENNQALQKILHQYFSLVETVISKDGKIFLPLIRRTKT